MTINENVGEVGQGIVFALRKKWIFGGHLQEKKRVVAFMHVPIRLELYNSCVQIG